MNGEIIRDLPFVDYLKLPGVSSTALKNMTISPLLYKHRKAEPLPDNGTLRKGRACHTAALEPMRFLREYALYTGGKRDKRVKKYQEFLEQNPGKTILNEAEYSCAERVQKAVRGHGPAMDLLGRGESELTIIWTHPRTGLKCKSRIDWLAPNASLDLKTTRDPAPYKFSADSARLSYDLQFAFYGDALASVGYVHPFKVIAAQNTDPFDVVVYDIPEHVLQSGREKYDAALDRLIQCKETNSWPGIAPDEELTLELPAWATPEPETEPLTFNGTDIF